MQELFKSEVRSQILNKQIHNHQPVGIWESANLFAEDKPSMENSQ